MDKKIYVTRFSVWDNPESPSLDFAPAGFARRLSPLTKMTVRVLHDLEPPVSVKTVFASFHGEIGSQFKINKTFIEDGEVKPAAFSLSVFNTAPAQASIALNLTGGYSAVYPRCFRDAVYAAASAFCDGGETEHVAFVYADEAPPSEYVRIADDTIAAPLAFAVLLQSSSENLELPARPLPLDENSAALASPHAFLAYLAEG